MAPIRWQPDRSDSERGFPMPPMATAIRWGFMGRCPSCGQSHLFNGFLKVRDACQACSAPLGLARADDAPPYLTILLVAHLVVPAMFIVDRAYTPDTWVMTSIFVPMSLALCLGLLRPIKGGVVGLMMKLNMLKAHLDEV
jgi:uncharacterized protein (DUF983 family)